MSTQCAVCGKERGHSTSERSHWLPRLGYGVAYTTILSPFAFLLAAFPFVPIKARQGARIRRPLKMCQVCEWTFGAFTLAVALILIGIAYVIWSTGDRYGV
jgi:hypothetical protein